LYKNKSQQPALNLLIFDRDLPLHNLIIISSPGPKGQVSLWHGAASVRPSRRVYI